MKTLITFIGAGVMARSLILGLKKTNSPFNIRVSDPDIIQLDTLQQLENVTAFTSNSAAVNCTDVIVLAVKPQIMQRVCESLKLTLKKDFQMEPPLIISIAAGISIEKLNKWLSDDRTLPIVRCMPNTPSLVQKGMTGLYANPHVTNGQRDISESILKSVGKILWLSEEDKLDAVTAVSGSGPAYFFLVMEAMQAAAEKLGLSADEARLLVSQTAHGATTLAAESKDDVSILRKRVTSKGGTTEAALQSLMDGGIHGLFEEALKAAENRSKELKKL